MLLKAHGVVAATVERLAVEAPEVLHPRQRDGDQTVQELVHAFLAQGDLGADHHALAQLQSHATPTIVRNLRIFVHPRANAMPYKIPYNTEAIGLDHFLHCRTHIAQRCSDLYCPDRILK